MQETERQPLPSIYQWWVFFYCRPETPPELLRFTDKTIKLWKVFEKSVKVVAENNGSVALSTSSASSQAPLPSPTSSSSSPPPPLPRPTHSSNGTPYFRLPRMTYHDTMVAAVPRKVYANAHAYHINSISINSDGETYMSADDLRVNLWNLNISDQSFSLCFFTFSCHFYVGP